MTTPNLIFDVSEQMLIKNVNKTKNRIYRLKPFTNKVINTGKIGEGGPWKNFSHLFTYGYILLILLNTKGKKNS